MSRTCGHPVVSAENPIQGGGGGVRQTFVNFYLGNSLCAGGGTAILETSIVCWRPLTPPCISKQIICTLSVYYQSGILGQNIFLGNIYMNGIYLLI